MTEEEIERSLLWKKAREMKKGGYKPNVQMIVDKIALGTEEHRGAVRGIVSAMFPKGPVVICRTIKILKMTPLMIYLIILVILLLILRQTLLEKE